MIAEDTPAATAIREAMDEAAMLMCENRLT